MSLVKIKGNDSGTGTVTLEAPNTSTNRSIALPDADGTLVHADASGNVEIDGILHIDGSDNGNVANVALTRTDASWLLTNQTNFRIYGGTGDTTNPATKQFEIDTSGRVTTPNQPAFTAASSAFTFNPPSAAFTTEYNVAALNRGNHYSTTTGRFTAPVAGVYEFHHQLTARTASTSTYEPKLYVNGVEKVRSFHNGGGQSHGNQTSMHIYLNAGDYIQAGAYVGAGVTFSGQADMGGAGTPDSMVSGWWGHLIG